MGSVRNTATVNKMEADCGNHLVLISSLHTNAHMPMSTYVPTHIPILMHTFIEHTYVPKTKVRVKMHEENFLSVGEVLYWQSARRSLEDVCLKSSETCV